MIHGKNMAEAPKYCSRPIPALIRAAASQAQAAACASRVRVAPASATIQAAVQAMENSQGATAGDGPVAKGFSQGRARRIEASNYNAIKWKIGWDSKTSDGRL